ncbi:DUF2252 family protein [Acinetobacter sp. WZC-1]|uniref:DUF2252 family protein n=1 Tax=Acinetobacter sp. WZC-1 TaxID=3459034 RepID=UPI00403DDF1B
MRDAYERILGFNQGRDPRFLALKFSLMSRSAFRFFRGSCHLFYEDLAEQQNWKDPAVSWICGDLHVENFGTYKSGHGVVYFDINDFDEGLLAHPTWELARFLCSVLLAGRELKLELDELKSINIALLEDYLTALKNGKAYAVEKETIDGILKKYIKSVEQRDPQVFLDAHSEQTRDGQRLLRIDQKKYFPVDDPQLKQHLLQQLSEYFTRSKTGKANTQVADTEEADYGDGRYQAVDVAIRQAGTGSIGIKRYGFLAYDAQSDCYALFDMKQAQPSSLNHMSTLNIKQPVWEHEAQRIQTIQHFMQYVTPSGLDQIMFQGEAYIIKQLQSEQDKMDFKLCVAKPEKFMQACHHMACLLAYAQIRSAGRQGSSTVDELIDFAEQAGEWKTQVLEYAYNYHLQVVQDYQHFCQADKPAFSA